MPHNSSQARASPNNLARTRTHSPPPWMLLPKLHLLSNLSLLHGPAPFQTPQRVPLQHHYTPPSRVWVHHTPAAPTKLMLQPPMNRFELVNGFPSSFDPRNTRNMPAHDKVNQWISDVPVYPLLRPQETELATWRNDCYPGIVSSSSNASEDEDEDEAFNLWNTSREKLFEASSHFGLYVDKDDVCEYQAHQITRYVKRLYHLNTNDRVGQPPSNKKKKEKKNWTAESTHRYDYDDTIEDQADLLFSTGVDYDKLPSFLREEVSRKSRHR